MGTVKELLNNDVSAYVWGAKPAANTPVHPWLAVEYGPCSSRDALKEFGKCLIPLDAHSAFLLKLIHFLSFPKHLTLDLLACPGCCWFRTISAYQTPPGEAAARVPGSCIFLISLHFWALCFLGRWHFYHVFGKSIWPTRESISLIVKHDHLFWF